MSRSLLHDWEVSIEKNKNNAEELLKIAEDIYNTAYARGKASIERPHGEWEDMSWFYHKPVYKCTRCNQIFEIGYYSYCPHCGTDMRGKENAKT